MSDEKKNVILDCDPGLDDALAIYTAHRYANLVAITTVAGNVSLHLTTRNALNVLETADLSVPVHRGESKPLERELEDARDVHGAGGLGPIERTPAGSTESDDAISFLLDAARSVSDLHLVAIGPLTNIARAIERDAGFTDRLASLTIMGGSIHAGNVTAAAEFNIWADPEAAAMVFRTALPVMIGLDVTHQVRMGHTARAAFRSAATPPALLAAELIEFYGRGDDAPMHDPCAVLAVTHPHHFGLESRAVGVELTGTLTRGMTVVDERPRGAGPANSLVGYRVAADPVLELIVDAVTHPTG